MKRCLIGIFLILSDGQIVLDSYNKDEKRLLKDKTLEMFRHAYDNYMENAYPADELMPLSCKGRTRGKTPSRGDIDDALGNFQLTLVDTLDTLALLGYVDEFESAIHKLNATLNFDGDFMISTFETNIRMLGGLLGGHSMAIDLAFQGKMKYDNCLLRFAKTLGDRLIPAFNTSTGIPMSRINLRTGSVKKNQPETCTACAGTLILEFAALSRFTGDPIYEEKARTALDSIWKKRHHGSGLVGTVINTNNGDWVRRESGVGAGIDSYYEYLLKAYILLGDEEYLERFNVHYSSIKRYIKQGPMMIDVQMHRPSEQARSFMDALSAFWPGVQVLKGDIQSAIETHELLYQVFLKYGFLPEAFTHRFDVHWGQNPLRPEFAESTYLLYKATEDPYYLKVGREIIETLEKHARVPCGFSGIKDVRKKTHEDRMDSFFLAEMFKYLYLLFAEEKDMLIDPNKYVFTTEAHMLPLNLSLFKNHTAKVTPKNTNVNTDGNADRSCLNPLPNGRTGKLYTVDELNHWRYEARDWMENTNPSFKTPAAKVTNKKTGRPEVTMHTRLFAKDFIPGNVEHERLLRRMGIQITNTASGHVQLIHLPNIAQNTQAAQEGLVFMQEMIELNAAAEKQADEDATNIRYVSILSESNKLYVLGGPAQFGNDFTSGPVVGQLAKANPYNACTSPENKEELKGKIAIIKRGDCMFAQKVKHVENAGAIGAIIIDNMKDSSSANQALFSMAGDGETEVRIGSVFLASIEANKILQRFQFNGDVKVVLSDKVINVTDLMERHQSTKPTITSNNPKLPEEATDSMLSDIAKIQRAVKRESKSNSADSDKGPGEGNDKIVPKSPLLTKEDIHEIKDRTENTTHVEVKDEL